jgi:hypothetical protein
MFDLEEGENGNRDRAVVKFFTGPVEGPAQVEPVDPCNRGGITFGRFGSAGQGETQPESKIWN